MVISTGVGVPGVRCAVRALNSLQKSIDLTPLAPRAGPTGGEGEAFAAGTTILCCELFSLLLEGTGSVLTELFALRARLLSTSFHLTSTLQTDSRDLEIISALLQVLA